MLPLKLRLKIFSKLAQAVPGSPASPASPTSPASPNSPNAPTQPASTTSQTLQPPPAFNVASGPWAWVRMRYNAATVGYLQTIMNAVNTVMHYATDGKFNLAKNQNNLGGIDSSATGSTDGKNSILLAQSFYKTFLNNGNDFQPSAAQINNWVNTISGSQPLLNLSQLSPTGKAVQQLRLPDTFRQTILNNLGYIRQYNPVQPAQQR